MGMKGLVMATQHSFWPAKEAIFKYDAVVNDAQLGTNTDNSHVMHFDPADSSVSTEPAQR